LQSALPVDAYCRDSELLAGAGLPEVLRLGGFVLPQPVIPAAATTTTTATRLLPSAREGPRAERNSHNIIHEGKLLDCASCR
jgi:hypothetical protein